MSITIDMPAQEIEALKQLTKLDDDAEAIIQAAREYLRLSRLRELKSVSGKVDYDDSPWTKEELQALAWEAGKSAGWEDMDEYDNSRRSHELRWHAL